MYVTVMLTTVGKAVKQ